MDRVARMWPVAGLLALLFMASSLVSPLYVLYQEAFAFSELTLTLVYAAYVAGNLCGLVFLGRLSDEIGRRPVALIAIALAGASTVLFLFARSTDYLFWARSLSGLSVAMASGAGTAWLIELVRGDRGRATLIATVANFTGIGIGPLAAGLLAQYAPWPLHLSFVAYAAGLAPLAWAVASTPETVERRPAIDRTVFKPRIGIPRALIADFMAPAATAFAIFALGGFYLALAPSLLKEELGISNHLTSGVVIGELFAVSVIGMLATRKVASDKAMPAALLLLLPSVALLVGAQALRSLALLVAGSACAGLCVAIGYRSSLELVNAIAPADRRAEVASSYFIAVFAGNSLPVIGVGVLSTFWDPLAATITFAVTLTALAALALALTIRRGRLRAPGARAPAGRFS
jgi:MFS family permease